MRRSGLVDHTRGLGAHDHVCWRYDDVPEFEARAREFLLDGLEQGYRVCYVASGDVDALVHGLRGIDGIDRALREGAAQVTSLEATYPVGAVVEPEAQVRAYTAATEAAVRDGFAGFRVVAEATPLVRTPKQLAAFARYEHLVDRYMADHPFSAMCAYSSAEIDDSAFAELACLHPNTNARAPGFRLHAADGHTTALGGEVDSHADGLFTQALNRVDLRARDGELVLDARELTFIDHNNLLRLADHAARLGAPLALRGSWPGLARLVDLLDLRDVHVDHAA
ncbi:anti-anti-sigma regulatory factor [Saccharothrix carnea]|uniref:Anti-anti-sigma regulatory factor n=1 Tax=Saccharothrix carnea TaxID=1280637 RepID=A0A2P8HLS4_SACCR|nr:MEDS domain-containing protein [Saccharothrix carnea]PSL47156.1 anti-anti-sigma regulatory factor [Saccharothrix carnea]